MKKSINRFCNGYKKGSYLVKYNVEELEKNKDLKRVVDKLVKADKEGPLILMTDRWFNPRKYNLMKPKKLLGPIAMTYMTSNKYPHKICLFGDFHTLDSEECPKSEEIQDFIINYTKNSPKFIDIFLEAEYVSEKGITEDKEESIMESYLFTKVVESFDPTCFEILKDNCDLQTSRMHYTDMRNLYNYSLEKNFVNNLNVIMSWTLLLQQGELTGGVDTLRYIIKKFLSEGKPGLTNMNTLKKLITGGIREERIMKQIENIPDKNIRNTIMTSYKTDLKNALGVLETKLISKKLANIRKINFKKLFLFAFYVLEVYTVYMDYYLMGRVFRTFRDIPGEYSEPAYNSIIYAGDIHIGRYIDILQTLGFKINFSDKNMDKCLNLKGLSQPLFMNI